jgi:hypothetical protein
MGVNARQFFPGGGLQEPVGGQENSWLSIKRTTCCVKRVGIRVIYQKQPFLFKPFQIRFVGGLFFE